MSEPAWRGGRSALVLAGGGSVLLSRETARLVQSLLRFYVDNLSGPNGLEAGAGLTPAMRELRDALAVSAGGHPDSRQAVDPAACISSGPVVIRADDLVSTAEVAKLLQVGPRHARRLVAGDTFGTVRRIGRSNFVSRAEVLANLAGHDEKAERDA